MLIGASAALYAAAKAEDPRVRVGISARETIAFTGGLIELAFALYLFRSTRAPAAAPVQP